MGNPRLVSLMVCIAAIASLVLSGCTSSSPSDDGASASSSAAVEPVALFPEKGALPAGVDGSQGDLVCSDDVATTELRIGGTVSENGDTVTVDETDDGLVVTFKLAGDTLFAESLIVGYDTATGIPATDIPPGVDPTYSLSFKDFGPIERLTACGGGM